MFAEPIAYHAVNMPDAPAVRLPNGYIPFRRLNHLVNALAAVLAERIPEGSIVGLRFDDLFLHWLTILALSRLRMTSVSMSDAIPMPPAVRRRVAAVCHDGALDSQWDIAVAVDRAWLIAAGKSPPVTLTAPKPRLEDVARLVLSSGTTGAPKAVGLTHGVIVQRMRTGVFGQVMRHDSRLLARIGPSTGGGFVAPLRTWWFGGTVCLVEASPENLRVLDVRALLVSPAQLRDLIRRLPRDFEPLPNLTVLAGGTALPLRLNSQARRRLTPNIVMTYGSTETGTAAVARTALLDEDPSVTGIVLPWVDVEVVDEAGQIVPPGEFGDIRIKSNEMVHEYFEDADATAKHFRDGWFYTGDVGSVSPDGKLRLLGRSDDVLNFGGAKISPRLLEDEVAKQDVVVDQAAFAAPHRSGLSLPWVAVVVSGSFDAEGAAQQLRSAFPWLTVPTNFVVVDAIPRNHMGKADRDALLALAASSLQQGGAAP